MTTSSRTCLEPTAPPPSHCRGGNPPPVDGDSVYIPPGITVIMDINPPVLGALVLDGTLKFDPSVSELNLTTGYILVRVRCLAGCKCLHLQPDAGSGGFTQTLEQGVGITVAIPCAGRRPAGWLGRGALPWQGDHHPDRPAHQPRAAAVRCQGGGCEGGHGAAVWLAQAAPIHPAGGHGQPRRQEHHSGRPDQLGRGRPHSHRQQQLLW
jgi:hypothetical protein